MIIAKLVQKDFITYLLQKAFIVMKQLKLRFEIEIWNLFLMSVILIWPILQLFDTGWLFDFKNNILATCDQFIEELEKQE